MSSHPETCYEEIERMYADDLIWAIERANSDTSLSADRRTWITDRAGKRVAAIVPAEDLEYWENGE